MYNVKERDLDGYPIGGYINENNRISGFQWALTIFVFYCYDGTHFNPSRLSTYVWC